MCIITATVSSVDSTNIFVMPSTDKSRQLTVYNNRIATTTKNLMILPVPYPQSIQFESSIMNYKTLFNDINKSFRKTTLELLRSIRTHETLKIYDIGSYKVSIANSVQDIMNLDKTFFSNPEELYEVLQDEYLYPFGFLVCALKEGESAYNPLAYSHSIWKDQLFVPTRHYHPGDMSGNNLYSFTQDWDHKIFSVGVPFTTDTHAPTEFMPLSTNKLEWKHFPSEFQWGNHLPLRRLQIKGGYKNIDITFPLYSHSHPTYQASFLGMQNGLIKFFNK